MKNPKQIEVKEQRTQLQINNQYEKTITKGYVDAEIGGHMTSSV